MSQNRLFSEFSASTKNDWQEKAVIDLKGKSIDSLASNWYGLNIDPYYTVEDLASINTSSPIIRSNKGWINYVRIDVLSEKQANKQAHEALMLGATGIIFNLHITPDYSKLLDAIDLQHCAIAFSGNSNLDDYVSHANAQNQAENIAGFINSDDLGGVTGSSNFFTSVLHGNSENEILELENILHQAYKAIYSLEKDQPTRETNVAYQVQMGTNYFFGIAKIRALRLLLQRFYNNFNLAYSTDSFHIIAASAPWVASEYDPHENMLKATTSAMAAIMGGCDSLIIAPGYDDDQEDLVARNISSILEFESYLDKVADPAAGSYFIENLTNNILDKVWSDFKANSEKGEGIKVDIADQRSYPISKKSTWESAEGIPVMSSYSPEDTSQLPFGWYSGSNRSSRYPRYSGSNRR